MSEQWPQQKEVRSRETFNHDANFVERCKAVLPAEFYPLVDAGNQRIGAALLELSRQQFSPKDIVRMINGDNIDELYAEAARREEAGRLYGELANYPISEHGHDSDVYADARGIS